MSTTTMTREAESRPATVASARLSSTPTSYDPKTHQVDLTASTGARVDRGWCYEELEVSPAACDVSRAAAGCMPLLDSHDASSIDNQLGRVVRARFEGAALIVRVQFSDTPRGQSAEARVASGDLQAVSVGYQTLERSQAGFATGDVPVMVATRWVVLEVSLVASPADPTAGVRNRSSVEVRDPHDPGGMSDAIAARMMGRAPDGRGRQYVGYRVVDFMAARSRTGSQGTALEMLQRSVRMQSDIGLIFEDAARKVLLANYQSVRPAYRRVATKKPFSDFRQHRFYRSNEFPALLSIAENGAAVPGALKASRESVGLATGGRLIRLSRQAILNDDLGAIGGLAAGAAKAAIRLESAMFASLLAMNSGHGPTLSDGRPMFDAAHGNLAAERGALSGATLASARIAMRRQQDLDGHPIDLDPRTVFVAPEQEEAAEESLAQSNPLVANDNGGLENRLEVVVNNYLTAGPWYTFADPEMDNANFVWGYLRDAQGPDIVERTSFDTDGVGFRVTHDFGIGGVDFRYGYMNGGAA